MTCPMCNGSGVLVSVEGEVEGCKRCYGHGEVPQTVPIRYVPKDSEKLTRKELNYENNK